MTHGSLFSGIGGFDLAAEWMGWENKFHCEWNPFGQKVLHHYWPNAEQFTDITKSDFTKYANRIDVLTGGFPCQPFSTSGKRLGKEDDRHLWPEMLRAIREIKPRWVVGENVFGLINWSEGLVFHEVQTDLANEGYEVQPYVLPAASVNAPHRRDRVWFVAHSNHERGSAGLGQVQGEDGEVPQWDNNAQSCDTGNEFITDTNQIRFSSEMENRELGRKRFAISNKRNAWDSFPTVSPICNGNDGLSDRLDIITFPKWRAESIKAGGNAIVPQVVYQIFKAIYEYERINRRTDNP
jgi:DNA (cytosine-5)-methyltransferase 1